MNPFEAFRNNGADSQKPGAFGRPIAGTSGSVLLACKDNQWHLGFSIGHRGIVDGDLGPLGIE
jgi:hypothetical protein